MCQWTVGLLDWWLVGWWVGGGFALLGSGIVGSLDWWGVWELPMLGWALSTPLHCPKVGALSEWQVRVGSNLIYCL